MSSSWEYAAGRISALEASLLPERVWNQLLNSRDLKEVLKILGDSWYGRLIQSGDVEEALLAPVSMAENELLELSPEPRLVKGILLRRDVRNARYAWKSLSAGGDGTVPLEDGGTIPSALFQRAWSDWSASSELPREFRDTLERIHEGAQGNTMKVDLLMDHLAARVEATHLGALDGGLAEYPKTRIELRNFLTSGRSAVEGLPAAELAGWILPGGYHSPADILEAYRKNRLPDELANTPGFEAAAAALKTAIDEGSFLLFQKESDRVLLNLLSRLSGQPFGPGLLASYVLRRELESMHLNLVVAAKRAGMDTAKLQARLPR